MYSSVRQRIAKASSPPARKGGTTENRLWEISSDGEGSGVTSTSPAVPMYHPLHYQSVDSPHATLAATPHPSSSTSSSSGPNLSWEAVVEAKKKNERIGGGGGVTGGGTTSKLASLNSPSAQSYIGLRGNPLPSLAPAFIPDNKYQAYLQGRMGKSRRPPPVNRFCMAQFCASFSMVAVVCLVFIGIIIDRQPLYIPGVLPQHVQYTTGDRKQQVFYALPTANSARLEPASNAYRSAALYLLTACLCYGYVHNCGWWIKKYWLQHQGRPYRDIPDHASDGDHDDNDNNTDDVRSTVPTFHNGGGNSRDELLPIYGVDRKKYNPFQQQNGSPFVAQLWQSASSMGHRLSLYVSTAWADSQNRRRNKRRFEGAKDV